MPGGFSTSIADAEADAEEDCTMIGFLNFEASWLSDRSVPVEVGWAIENDPEETHVILPEPG